MNQKIYIITLVGVISLAVVSAISKESLMDDLKESYSLTFSELTDADRENLDYFKQVVLFQSKDVHTVHDLFFNIPEKAFTKAIIVYMRNKSRPYKLDETENQGYADDYEQLLVVPCENLRGLWVHPLSFLLENKIDKELVSSIKAEHKVYNWLKTAYICNHLVDDKIKMGEKSFKYMVSRGGNKPDDHVEAESVAN